MYLTDDEFKKLKDEQKELQAQIKAAERIESGVEVGGFMGMVKGIADSFGVTNLPRIFLKVGNFEGVGNFVCKQLTQKSLSDFFNEFKQPENIAEVKNKLAEKMQGNPLLGLFNQFLDGVEKATDMQATSVDPKQLEAYHERLEVINEQIMDERNYRTALKIAEQKALIEVTAKKVRNKVKAGAASGNGKEAGEANLNQVSTAGISNGAAVTDQNGAGNVPIVETGSKVRQPGD